MFPYHRYVAYCGGVERLQDHSLGSEMRRYCGLTDKKTSTTAGCIPIGGLRSLFGWELREPWGYHYGGRRYIAAIFGGGSGGIDQVEDLKICFCLYREDETRKCG